MRRSPTPGIEVRPGWGDQLHPQERGQQDRRRPHPPRLRVGPPGAVPDPQEPGQRVPWRERGPPVPEQGVHEGQPHPEPHVHEHRRQVAAGLVPPGDGSGQDQDERRQREGPHDRVGHRASQHPLEGLWQGPPGRAVLKLGLLPQRPQGHEGDHHGSGGPVHEEPQGDGEVEAAAEPVSRRRRDRDRNEDDRAGERGQPSHGLTSSWASSWPARSSSISNTPGISARNVMVVGSPGDRSDSSS